MTWKSGIVLAALMVCIAGATPGAAQAPPQVAWAGLAVVETVTPQCGNSINGLEEVGRQWNSVYFPAGLGSNGPDGTLSLRDQYVSFVARIAGGSFADNAIFAGTNVDPLGLVQKRAGRVVSFSTSPAIITESTEFITVIAKLSNVGAIQGCTLKFRAAMTLVSIPAAPPSPPANSESSP